MKHAVQLGGVVALLVITSARAAEPLLPADAPHPIFAAPRLPSAPPVSASIIPVVAPSRAISAETAARFAAASPRYVPATERSGSGEPASRPGREPLTPGIVRLSPFLVAEKKELLLDDRKILTAKGEEALAMHRYITETDRALNFFTLPLFGTPKEARAVFMLREQQRLDDMARFQNLVELTRLTSPRDAAKLKQAADTVFMREPTSGR